MKECKLYQGQLSDGSLEDVIPFLLSKAIELHDTIYVEWNGAIIAVNSESSYESILKDYEEGLHKNALLRQERDGRLISFNDLGNKLGLILQDLFKK